MYKGSGAGQPALRASIASKLKQAGMPASKAEREATLRLLELRQMPAGHSYNILAGDTVFVIKIVQGE